MKASRTDLVEKIRFLIKAKGKGIPVLTHVKIHQVKKWTSLTTTDLDVSAVWWFRPEESGPGTPWDRCVPAVTLSKVLATLKSDQVELVPWEETGIEVRGNGAVLELHGLPGEDFPIVPTKGPWEKLGKMELSRLRALLGRATYAVSNEDSRFQLQGAQVSIEGGRIVVEATDGHRLTVTDEALPGGVDTEAFIASRSLLKLVEKLPKALLSETVELGHTEHHLRLRVGLLDLVGRKLEGTFPNTARVLERDMPPTVATVSVAALERALRMGLVCTSERARAVRLHFNGTLTVSSANPDLGSFRDDVGGSVEGPEVKIGVAPQYLLDMALAAGSKEVEIGVRDENSLMKLRPATVTEYRHDQIVMPMRI